MRVHIWTVQSGGGKGGKELSEGETNEEIQREKILRMAKKIRLRKPEWNALGVMLLISRRERMREQAAVREYLKKKRKSSNI